MKTELKLPTTPSRQLSIAPSKSKSTALPLQKTRPKAVLKNIIELTQENEPNQDHQTQSIISKSPTHEPTFYKYLCCFAMIWKIFCKKEKRIQLDINETEFTQTILKIKKKNHGYNIVLPPQKIQKKVLVLDLDETLIHTTFNKPDKYDFETEVLFNGRNTKIYTLKRFGVDSFLFEMSKIYEIVLFTASQKVYADKIIDTIDRKRRIAHRLYRDNCIIINKSYYLKNLKILGRNLEEVVIVDDNLIAAAIQPENLYQIEPFTGNPKDRQLFRLMAFLRHINRLQTILPIKQHRIKFQEMEINLKKEQSQCQEQGEGEEEEYEEAKREEEIQIQAQTEGESERKAESKSTGSRSLAQRQKQYKHKKTNSEVESLTQKTDDTEPDQGEITASDLIKKL